MNETRLEHLHWVCFTCRKQVRKPLPSKDAPRYERSDVPTASDCPLCRAPMVEMGSFFRPPRRSDRRAWEQLRLLAEHGVRFYTGSSVYIWGDEGITQRSRRVTQCRLAQCSCQTQMEGQRLLQRIAHKLPK